MTTILSEQEIVSTWQGMPGGPDGWLTNFGFLQFARAIEAKAITAYAAKLAQGVELEAVAEFRGRRLAPNGTTEFWGWMLCDAQQDPVSGTQLVPLSTAQAAVAAERAKLQRLADEMEFEGNSVSYIYARMKAYRLAISSIWDVLRRAGLETAGGTHVAEAIRQILGVADVSPAPAAEPAPDALAVLRELVALQVLQDEVHAIEFIGPGGTHGEAWEAVAKEKRRDYIRRAGPAWAAARAVLATPSPQPAPAAEPVTYHRDDEGPEAAEAYASLLARLDANGRAKLVNHIAHGARATLAPDGGVVLTRRDWQEVRVLSATPSPLPAAAGVEERAGLVDELKRLREGLRFYAGAGHFHGDPDDLDEFDSVSGEPESWLCHSENSLMVENGGVARLYLRGKRANWVDGDDDDTPTPIEGEVSVLDRLASSAAQVPEGMALVPLRMNSEMQRVSQEDGWQWEDLLAAAGGEHG